jgi:hypothetical protein
VWRRPAAGKRRRDALEAPRDEDRGALDFAALRRRRRIWIDRFL